MRITPQWAGSKPIEGGAQNALAEAATLVIDRALGTACRDVLRHEAVSPATWQGASVLSFIEESSIQYNELRLG